jgi:hypothetical protein
VSLQLVRQAVAPFHSRYLFLQFKQLVDDLYMVLPQLTADECLKSIDGKNKPNAAYP